MSARRQSDVRDVHTLQKGGSMIAPKADSLTSPSILSDTLSYCNQNDTNDRDDKPLVSPNINRRSSHDSKAGHIEPTAPGLQYPQLTNIDASVGTANLPRKVNIVAFREIPLADKPFIELYFMHHPSEFAMGNEFVEEMNGFVLSLLQQSPSAVSDSLSTIGENYVRDVGADSTLQISNRKTRLLSRLRMVNEDGSSLELISLMLLGLCAVEVRQPPASSVLLAWYTF